MMTRGIFHKKNVKDKKGALLLFLAVCSYELSNSQQIGSFIPGRQNCPWIVKSQLPKFQ